MRRQDWWQLASVSALAVGIASAVRRRPRRALAFFAVAAAGDAVARRSSRGRPGPFPASLRWVLGLPRPGGPVRRALRPRPGERILEIGPGVGQQAVQVARWVAPTGHVDVLDVQQAMLDATTARAERRGVRNVDATRADASGRLPYDDATFDAAYLSSVLGEVPDRGGTLRELHRVLKPGGRLIVAEVAVDPDFIPARRLSALAERCGFRFDSRLGPRLAYHARFTKA